MINHNNYVFVNKFICYHQEVMQRDPRTAYNQKGWLKHLLRWADDESFAHAPDIRPVFPRYLQSLTTPRGKPLAPAGIRRGCQDARMFFEWLSQHHRAQFKAITPAWIVTLQPPRLKALPHIERNVVTLEMVRQLMEVPHEPNDLALWRDKATAAFLFLSGIRASAFCTLPLQCINLRERVVYQYPTMGVRTKNRKAMVTHLLEIPDLLAVCMEWDEFVRAQLPPTAMWYSVIDIACGAQMLTAAAPGEYRRNGLGDNVRDLFIRAGLQPRSPHAFRHGHATHALQMANDVADLKAVSMNLGHSSLTITDAIYVVLSDKDMAERIARLGQAAPREDMQALIEKVLAAMRDKS